MSRPTSPIRRDLRACLVDGCGFCVMLGAGETYFAAFALALGVDEVTAGLAATVPMLFGAALQLGSLWAVRRLGSNRRWVTLAGAAQAASFIPLVVAALAGEMPTVLLFAVLSFYFAAGFAGGPAWATWIQTLVPRRITPHYFANRTLWSYVSLLAALAVSGVALEFGEERGGELTVFAGLFAAAGLARLVSARCLALQSEPVAAPAGRNDLSMTDLARRVRGTAEGRLLVFLLATQAAIQIAQPFVTSYLKGELRMSYVEFAGLVAIPFVARIAALPFLGRLAHRLGPRRLMWIASLGLVPAAALWVVSASVPWIALVQAVTGVAFAALELANLLLWFETIRPEERTSILTTYQFFYGAAVVTGSVVGSLLLAAFGEGRDAFVVVFAVSAAARLAAAGLFAWTNRAGGLTTSRAGVAAAERVGAPG